jgi:GNAT superfamily N-acetyltransferase
MSDIFRVRLATASDLEVISWQRARMFKDMGRLPGDLFESFRVQSRDVLQRMFEANEYIGWLASPESQPDQIIAGAGVQLRKVPPHPQSDATGKIDIVSGHQAIIGNVYTKPEWRRRGVATLLMKTIIDWTREQGIDSLLLYASDEGRTVYQRLGFTATSEMRFNR